VQHTRLLGGGVGCPGESAAAAASAWSTEAAWVTAKTSGRLAGSATSIISTSGVMTAACLAPCGTRQLELRI